MLYGVKGPNLQQVNKLTVNIINTAFFFLTIGISKKFWTNVNKAMGKRRQTWVLYRFLFLNLLAYIRAQARHMFKNKHTHKKQKNKTKQNPVYNERSLFLIAKIETKIIYKDYNHNNCKP